jgi:AraC-like DNA-binding protein
MIEEAYRDAAVVYGNFRQFAAHEELSWSRVESRVLLWCRSGYGEIDVDGRSYRLRPRYYALLPWGHSIRYLPDRHDPFLIAAAHVIPRHSRDVPLEFSVAHEPEDPLAGSPWRQDVPIPDIPALPFGSLAWNTALGHLGEYVVQVLVRGEADETWARQLGVLLLAEIRHASRAIDPASPDLPIELQRTLQYIADHLEHPLDLDHLAHFAGTSRSTIGRMFRKHLDCSPIQWIHLHRVRWAEELLRTSRLSVAEVGRQVGIDDPYYFSKVFKRYSDMAPLEYRKTHGAF